MILYRFWFACAGLMLFFVWDRTVPSRRDLPLIFAAGLIGAPLQFLIQFEGLARTTVAHAALMVGTAPMLLAIAGALLLSERLDSGDWLAVWASTIGAALIIAGAPKAGFRSDSPSAFGDSLVLLSLVAAVAWVLLSKRLMRRYSALLATTHVFLAGTVGLTLWVWVRNGPPPLTLWPKTWFALAAQGLLATTLSTTLWNWGLRSVPASKAGIFVNFGPLLGSILGILLYGDRLGMIGVAGGTLILSSAVFLTTRSD